MLTSLEAIAAVAVPLGRVEYRLTGHHYGWEYDVRVLVDGARVVGVWRADGTEVDDRLREYAETTALAWAVWPLEAS